MLIKGDRTSFGLQFTSVCPRSCCVLAVVRMMLEGLVVGRTHEHELALVVECGGAQDAEDLSLKLEGFRPGACGHGSCLVPVT